VARQLAPWWLERGEEIPQRNIGAARLIQEGTIGLVRALEVRPHPRLQVLHRNAYW